MAIQSEFSALRDESDFRSRFLIPLLVRLGFSVVVDYHGKREFGIDVLFAEIDRFSHVRYLGLQTKFAESIGKDAMHDLIRACEEAFTMESAHPQTGQKLRISSFYAATPGSISDEARDLFFASLRPKHGDNIRLLAGKDLLALDRSATVSRVESVRELLVGLLIEVRHNERVLSQALPMLETIARGDGHNVQYPPFRLRLDALSSYLQRPFLVEQIPLETVERLWAVGTAFNRTLNDVGASPLHTVVSIKVPAIDAFELKQWLVPDVQSLKQAVNGSLANLGPLASV